MGQHPWEAAGGEPSFCNYTLLQCKRLFACTALINKTPGVDKSIVMKLSEVKTKYLNALNDGKCLVLGV